MAKTFRGLYTALITPFTDSNNIDYTSLEKLIAEQINAGVDGLVILGTTGESPTINAQERKALIEFIIKTVKNQTKVIIGTGGNNTDDSIAKSKQAEDIGADGLLLVNPYYNKPTQDGLYLHFKSIADSVGLPIILYNIQGRTCVNLETETLLKLVEHKNIAAVKEASGDINQIMDVIAKTAEDFSVLSGDDALTYSLINLGGDGVVSVLANFMPQKMKQLVDLALQGDLQTALKLHYEMLEIMRGLLAIGSNPMAIKTALFWNGKIRENFRLPLCSLNEQQKPQLEKLLS